MFTKFDEYAQKIISLYYHDMIKKLSILFLLIPKPSHISADSISAGTILLPLNTGVIAVSFSQFGYNIYNENIIGLGFARNFGDKLKIGL